MAETRKKKSKKDIDERQNDVVIEQELEKIPRKRGRKKIVKEAEVAKKPSAVQIIPLGGLGEIGKNLTVYRVNNEMIIVDCGMAFPDEENRGVDLIIPNFAFLRENVDKIKGLFITHAHEDHIGSIPYLLKEINIPIYATQLTLGLLGFKLSEHGLTNVAKLHSIKAGDVVRAGTEFSIEFIHITHSIPDSVSMAISTSAGVIVHTGDFKVDLTPVNKKPIDLGKFAELGNKGVLALLSDSTNVERPGYTHSESTIGNSFRKLFYDAGEKRIIIATFSSNVHRVQQALNCAEETGRKVVILGRSMVNMVDTATKCGCLKVPPNIIIDINKISQYDNSQLLMITTGSQGETLSALKKMATGNHRQVTVTPFDFVIISATPIPGNEKHVTKIVNDLLKLGAKVIYDNMYEVHVSGHACQEELKLMMALTRPQFFIPLHGEYKHLTKHAEIAELMNIPSENIVVPSLGNVIEIGNDKIGIVSQVQVGNVPIDGIGVGDVGAVVLNDRKIIGNDGMIIVTIPIFDDIFYDIEIVSRGFVYVRESEQLISEIKEVAKKSLFSCPNPHDWNQLKSKITRVIETFVKAKTGRTPMIIPIILENHSH